MRERHRVNRHTKGRFRGSREERSDEVIKWIEKFCLAPSGPAKGTDVVLSADDRACLRLVYDGPGGVQRDAHIVGELAAFLIVYHVCGPVPVGGSGERPHLDSDLWTVWNATSPRLRSVLMRKGERVVCPELGTSIDIGLHHAA